MGKQMHIEDLTTALKSVDTTGTLAINHYNGEWEIQLSWENFISAFGVYEVEIRKVDRKEIWFAHVYRNGVRVIACSPVEKVGDYV